MRILKHMTDLTWLLIVVALLARSAFSSETPDEELSRISEEMKDLAIQVDVFDQNPFQTGTALKGYFLSEKTLLLERDTFMQIRLNALETTEQIADYHFRLKTLRSHANNMLLQLMQALEHRNTEGFYYVEKPKHEQTFEQIVEECQKDPGCVEERLKNPETQPENVFLQNFALATQVFNQMPFMHEIEVAAIYQMTQLLYMEVFFGQSRLAAVEFNVFLEKQKTLLAAIEGNSALGAKERKLHTAMVVNTINRWKKEILSRKFDRVAEFKGKAEALGQVNDRLLTDLLYLGVQNPQLRRVFKQKTCNWFSHSYAQCKKENAYIDELEHFAKHTYRFLGKHEEDLPDEFWEKMKTAISPATVQLARAGVEGLIEASLPGISK